MTVVNLYDVQDYMGRELLGGEVSAASVLCFEIQTELEAWLGRSLEVATHEETLVVYPSDMFLELSFTPIVSIESVTLDGVALSSSTWIVDRSGIALLNPGSSLLSTSVAVVNYTAGLGSPAIDVAARILKARVARILDKRIGDELGLESLTIDRYSTKWFPEDGFTELELKAVGRYKRRMVTGSPGVPVIREPSWESYPP